MKQSMLEKKRKLKPGEKIPLMYDECYKIMFCDEERLEPLTILLSRILQVRYEDLEGRISLAPLKIPNDTIGEKKPERDIVVIYRREENNKIILEVNVKERFYQSVIDRNIYYMGRTSSKGLLESESYDHIEPTFLINFNTFYVDNIHKHVFDTYYFRNEEGYVLTEKQKILNINIVACRDLWYNHSYQKIENEYEKDLVLLCASMVVDKEKEFFNCIEEVNMKGRLKRIMEEVSKRMNSNEEMYGRYVDFMEENKRINDSIINEEKTKARKQGLEEGRQLNQREMILNMYYDNVDVSNISRYANLKVEEVKHIIDSNKESF